MKLPTLVQLAREQATFARYEDGALWYRIYWTGDDGISHPFEFPIPTDAPDLFYAVDSVLLDLAKVEPHDVVVANVKAIIVAALTVHQNRGAGGGKFLPEDRAIAFLRWIRPHLENLRLAQLA